MKIHGQGHVRGQRSRSCLTFKFQRSRLWSRSNPLVTFEAWSSIDMFAFHFVAIGPLLAEIWEIPYLTLKIRGQGHGQGQTWWSHLRPWSSIDMFAFVSVAMGPFLAEIWQIPYLTLKIQGQCHGQGHTLWSHLSPRVQSISLLFVSWQSDHFWLRYSKFHIWPWKI